MLPPPGETLPSVKGDGESGRAGICYLGQVGQRGNDLFIKPAKLDVLEVVLMCDKIKAM